MKKALWIFLIGTVLIVAALTFLILRFNVNDLRPLLAQQAEKALGRPVEIGRISLAYHEGLALRVQDLKIQPPLLELEEADVNLDVWALLRKEVRISSIAYKKPRIRLIKKEDGSIDLGESAPAPRAKPSSDEVKTKQPIVFSVDKIRVEDGEFIFEDRSKPGQRPLKVSNIDITIQDFSFAKPFSFDLAMAVDGGKQNLFLIGQADLGKVALDVTDGSISIGPKPLENIRAQLSYANRVATIQNISGQFAGGEIQLSGTVQEPLTRAQASFKAVFQDISMAELIPRASKDSATLQGHLTVALDAKSQGRTWEDISRSLNGQGRILLKEGVIMNKNILREIIQKLSRIPVVGESLVNGIPPYFQAKANEPHTLLAPIDFNVAVHDGGMDFNNLTLATDYFQLGGAGRIGLDRSVNARATLWMSPDLSGALMQAAPKLQVIANSQGLLEIPLTIDGNFSKLGVHPNTEYLTQKFLAAAAGQLMGDLFSKSGQGGSNALSGLLGQGSQTQEAGSESSSSDLVSGLLGKLRKKIGS